MKRRTNSSKSKSTGRKSATKKIVTKKRVTKRILKKNTIVRSESMIAPQSQPAFVIPEVSADFTESSFVAPTAVPTPAPVIQSAPEPISQPTPIETTPVPVPTPAPVVHAESYVPPPRVVTMTPAKPATGVAALPEETRRLILWSGVGITMVAIVAGWFFLLPTLIVTPPSTDTTLTNANTQLSTMFNRVNQQLDSFHATNAPTNTPAPVLVNTPPAPPTFDQSTIDTMKARVLGASTSAPGAQQTNHGK